MKYWIVGVILSTICWSLANPIQAHVLQTDGSIGALLHVNPDDDPIVGQPTDFFLEFKDTNNRFQISQCACVVTIFHNDQAMYTQPLADSSSFAFTFPTKGLYQLKVTGQPKIGTSFQPFTLSYDLRVTREPPSTSPFFSFFTTHGLHIIPIVLGVLLVGRVILQERRRQSP